MQALPTIARRETDLYAWFLDQAAKLRSSQPSFVDWSELAEELDEIVALARNEVTSRLAMVLSHLLKWKYQATKRDGHSWRVTIVRERLELSRLLLGSRNLRNYVAEESLGAAYNDARRLAGTEMRLTKRVWDRRFPARCE